MESCLQNTMCQLTEILTQIVRGQVEGRAKKGAAPREKMSAAVLMLVAAACPSALASSGATYAKGGCENQSTLSAMSISKRLHETYCMLEARTHEYCLQLRRF